MSIRCDKNVDKILITIVLHTSDSSYYLLYEYDYLLYECVYLLHEYDYLLYEYDQTL